MRGTFLELRSAALRHNIAQVCKLSGAAEVFAMVKANGYGHGLLFAAHAFAAHADGFGVALLEEALQLRAAGISAPLLLLEGVFDAEELHQAIEAGCELVIHSEWQLALLEQAVLSAPLKIWLKLDTGMHRVGLSAAQLDEVVLRLRRCQHAVLAGMMSHFACADMAEDDLSEQQLAKLRQVAQHYAVPFSAANSAAIIRYPDSAGVRVRPGIMLYGSSPFSYRTAAQLDLAVTQRLSARIIAINTVASGESVGYGRAWYASRASQIAVVAIGYGDGYPRQAPSGTPLAVKNADNVWRRTTLVGRVSMDMISIDVTDLPLTKVGDEVELWGDQVSVDEVASHCGTISYELFCRLTARPQRKLL